MNKYSRTLRFKLPGVLVIGIALLGFLGSSQIARAQFAIGDASNYAVLYEGSSSNSLLQISSGAFNGNTSTIGGEIGLGYEGGGATSVALNNPTIYNGAVNFAGSVNNGSTGTNIAGSTFNSSVSQVEADLDSLNALSSTFASETGSGITINMSTNNGGAVQTINATDGILDANGNEVFNVNFVNFNHGNTLIINGNGSQNVVLNINNASAKVGFLGTIELTGGLSGTIASDQVLFNITGSGTFQDGNASVGSLDVQQQGTILDPNGVIQIDSVNLNGRVFGGEGGEMTITSGGNIVAPPQDAGSGGELAAIPEPSTYALLAIGLGGLWLAMRRRRVGTLRLPGALAMGMALFGFLDSSQPARAGFTLGDASNYAVLYEGAGSHNLQINSGSDAGSMGATVTGNIGLGDEIAGAGDPTLQLNNPATIDGNINFAHPPPPNFQNSGGVLTGTITAGVTQVETDLNSLNALSAQLGGEIGTGTSISLSGNGGTQTINASDGTPDAYGNEVFTINSMMFNNGNTLIINGNSSQYVVLNYADGINTHFGGTIELTGGITSDQVLFNLYGGNDNTLMDGNTLQEAANKVTQQGTFLDPDGTINMNDVILDGRVFGGDSSDMQIVSGADIEAPEAGQGSGIAMIPEPSTYALGIGGFAMLLVFRRLRRSRV